MTSAKIRATVTVVFLLSASFLAVSTATAHCSGKHTGNHPHCDNGGGSGDGGTAAPVFVYVKPANGSDRVFLANADGTSATQIFVGTKFSFSQQPALYGDASGGEVLINDFSNLYRIAYSVNNGVINVDSTDRIQDRDIGPTTHTSNPDWSPDGSNFAFKDLNRIHLNSRATYVNGVVTDFGDPIFIDDRAGTGNNLILGIAWDSANEIHITVDDPDSAGWEVRRIDISSCGPTCDSTNTACIASSIGTVTCSSAPVLAAARFEHISVSHNAACPGTPPHTMVSALDANGDPLTFVLDGSMPPLTIPNFKGNDWTKDCAIVGSPGDGDAGPLNGGAIIEYNPFTGSSTTLIGSKGQTPDWMN